MSKKQMNNEAGFMGLEGMGALLFYLVMIAGAALLIAQLFSGGKLTEMEKGLTSMRMGIQQLYTAQGNYGTAGDITNTVADAGILPDGFGKETDKIISPWDTDITVAAGTDGVDFSITVVTPKDDCVKLATYDLNGWIKITDGTTAITDVVSAQTQCSKATGETATLVFTAK